MRSFRDLLGDRPRGRMPPPPPAGQALYHREPALGLLPPPPSTLPTNFRPAYLGLAPRPSASGSDAAAAVVVRKLPSRPARRGPDTATRSTSPPRSSTPRASRNFAAKGDQAIDSNASMSSRDSRGARPRGPAPATSPAARATSHQIDAAATLPPPPATIPTNFRPAFLGRAPPRSASGSGSRSTSPSSANGPSARTARRASSSSTRCSVPKHSSLRSFTAPRMAYAANPLDTPSGIVYRGVNAALAAWRARGSPGVAPPLVGILRPRSAINAPPAARSGKRVSFCIPAPRIEADSASPVHPLQGGSCQPAAAGSAGRHHSPAPMEEGWALVSSRREKREARILVKGSGPHLRHRPSAHRPRHHLLPCQELQSRSRSRSTHAQPPRKSPRRCRRCDASDHEAYACRDPIRCDCCGRSGHWASGCHDHLRRPTRSPASISTSAAKSSKPSSLATPRQGLCSAVTPSPSTSSPPSLPAPDMDFPGMQLIGDSATRGMDYLGAPSSPRLRSVITGSLNLEASAPADRVAPALGSVPRHLLLNVVVAPPPFAPLLDPVAAPAPALGPPARRLITSKIKPAGRRSASPTQARHALSASTSSSSSDLALSNQDHAHPAMDVCFYTLPSRVLANERCYKTSVDDVLSAENERTDLGLLQMQGKVGDRKTAESEVLLCLSTAATGEVVPEVSRPALECSPLMSSSHPLLSPDAGLTVLPSPGDAPCQGGHPSVDVESVHGLTMVFISPGDALCDGGFSSEDDEDEEMEELLPCLADQDQQELLLDGEEVGVWARREFQPVADVLDADAEAATIGNLLDAEADDDSDDDNVVDAAGTTPSSGIVIRSVADLFSLPVVPLLPTPFPRLPRADAALPAPGRRSSRLATKPQLSAVGKAKRVLHKKMGLDFGDMPLVEATKEFMNTCKKAPFSDSAISGVRTLLRLNLPSMTAADEALIGLAGPGGIDFPPPSALDVSA